MLNLLQSIINIKRTFNYKALFNIIYFVKNISVRYLYQKILITKKAQIRWGINPFFLFKPMSDKIHYVNLLPNKLLYALKVGNCPSFKQLIQKFISGTPIRSMGSKISLNLLKRGIHNTFRSMRLNKTKKYIQDYVNLILNSE